MAHLVCRVDMPFSVLSEVILSVVHRVIVPESGFDWFEAACELPPRQRAEIKTRKC